ncbi:hypothetical protein HB943_14875 [Listeria weihenstephanensis]|uniref:Mga helix-turn-helix domain-containing protein n=1 Tax=Listeria weihenstephanensis TaxID=1006155 RepID=A0A841ZBB1_9LIST|nr:helix-turn-helix domain-containing protein [Listeria weihenstephanensis]MBC1501882.1 hypothetical protein [Listeria weihenstephanensis]
MFLVLDTKEKLEVNLIKLLLNSNEWVTVNDAAIKLDSTVSKIYTATQNIINRNLDKDLVIRSQRNYGFRIDNKAAIDIDKIVNKYILDSIAFKILDSAFQEKTNIKKFCIEHHISLSKFYRSAKVVNSVLIPNQLTLDIKNFTIEGNEVYIREFMYYFYWETFKGINWPFKTVQKVPTMEHIERLAKKLHWKLNPFEYNQLAYRLVIIFLRYQRKNFVQEVPYPCIIPQLIKKLTSISLYDLLALLPPSVKKQEINYVSLIVSSYPWADAVDISVSSLVQWHKRKQTTPYRMTEYFLGLIKENTDITIDDKAWLNLIHIHMYAICFSSLHVSTDLKVHLEHYKSMHPDISVNLDKIIALVRTEFKEYPSIGPVYFAYYYMLFSLKYVVPILQKKLNILLFINKDRVFVDTIINQLQESVPYDFTISTSIQTDFKPDLVISNSHAAPNLDVPLFLTTFPISSQDIQRLIKTIKALI